MSRLIDADALRDNLKALAYDDWNQGVTTSWADAYSEVADMVEEMPTIEERKKGKWKQLDGSWFHDDVQCSICGNTLDMNGVNAGRGDANFCPNCGADMRGET